MLTRFSCVCINNVNAVHRMCECWEFPIVDSCGVEEDFPGNHMESLMRLYRPFCGSDGCKPQTTARRILAATRFPPPNFRGLVTSKLWRPTGSQFSYSLI